MSELRARIELTLTTRPLERVEGDVAVVGFFTDERPLRGGAARADWRLCGGLSRRLESGDLSGKSGEALLIGCGRALRAPRLLMLGLGDRKAFDQIRMSDEIRLAMDRCFQLGCSRVALAPLGIAADDIPRHAPALVSGIWDAWQKSPRSMALQLCVPSTEIVGVRQALENAQSAANATDLSVLIREDD